MTDVEYCRHSLPAANCAKCSPLAVRLNSSLAALRRDAARYRFLRTPSAALQLVGRQNIMIGNFGDELDAAVDAAMESPSGAHRP